MDGMKTSCVKGKWKEGRTNREWILEVRSKNDWKAVRNLQ